MHNTYKNNNQPPQPLRVQGPHVFTLQLPQQCVPLLAALGISEAMDIRRPWLMAHMAMKRRISLCPFLLRSWQPWWPLERVMGDVQWPWWRVVQISAPPANETLLLLTAVHKEKWQFIFQTYSWGFSCKGDTAAQLLMVKEMSVLTMGSW